jgi:hypothetical protein
MQLINYLLPLVVLATAAQACVRVKATFFYAKPEPGRSTWEAAIWDNGKKVCDLRSNVNFIFDDNVSPSFRLIFKCIDGYAASAEKNLADITMYINRNWGTERMPPINLDWHIVDSGFLPIFQTGHKAVWGCKCTQAGCKCNQFLGISVKVP